MAVLKLNNVTTITESSGAITITPNTTASGNLTVTGTSTLTGNATASGNLTVTGDLVPSTPLSHRNMIINGGMQVSQRNGTSSFAFTNGTFGTDRWKYNGDSSRLTAQQVADAPADFHYSLKLASVGNNSPGATAGSGMWMQLEGDDVTRLSYGTASAKTVTLSFWVKSSIAGNFGGAFSNGAMNRAYPFTFPVTTSWNRVSITIAGDTTGTWVTSGNGYGLRVILNSACGSNFNGSSAGAWVGADRRDVSGTVQLEATSGATLNITGVQLELGSSATPFEHRSYGDELLRCQRYYNKSYNTGVFAGAVTAVGAIVGWPGLATGTNMISGAAGRFPVRMRAIPTVSIYDPAGGIGTVRTYSAGGGSTDSIGTNSGFINESGIGYRTFNIGEVYQFEYHYTANSEL